MTRGMGHDRAFSVITHVRVHACTATDYATQEILPYLVFIGTETYTGGQTITSLDSLLIGKLIHENAYRTFDFGAVSALVDKVANGIRNQSPPPTTTPPPPPTTTTTTTTPPPPDRSPDGNCGNPWEWKDYWVGCVVVWRNEPISVGSAGNYSITDTNMPTDIVSYHYTPTGRVQLGALGLTTGTPTE
ncbi:hypothetical protein ACLMAL_32010 [Nocardia sp. CWNU-33]|uniref:hypothetical protein n=1 Tax=Nocardia sp. CWNU-33 TaxID=3392117 RepID=UPI00398F06B0